MLPQPKPPVDNLQDARHELWDRIGQTFSINELEVRRLLQRFKLLSDAAAADQRTIILSLHERAFLLFYLGKVDESLRLLADALYAGLPEIVYSNSRAHICCMAGRHEDAMNTLRLADSTSGDDINRKMLAFTCVQTGLFEKAKEIYEHFGLLDDPMYARVRDAVLVLNGLEALDERVVERLQIAGGIVRRMSPHPLIAFNLVAVPDEGVLYRFMVKCGIEKLVEIEEVLDQTLSMKFDDDLDEVLSIGVIPFIGDGIAVFGEDYHDGM